MHRHCRSVPRFYSVSISNVHFVGLAWPVILYCLRLAFAFAFTLGLETELVQVVVGLALRRPSAPRAMAFIRPP